MPITFSQKWFDDISWDGFGTDPALRMSKTVNKACAGRDRCRCHEFLHKEQPSATTENLRVAALVCRRPLDLCSSKLPCSGLTVIGMIAFRSNRESKGLPNSQRTACAAGAVLGTGCD